MRNQEIDCIAESGISKRLTLLVEKAKIPVYPSPERAVRGLKALLSIKKIFVRHMCLKTFWVHFFFLI
ncbi:MAG: hypothetical protein Q8N12_09560 [Thermodesulfovibrionales bacterium]|nr:hypothetical protein [Thermodesulfovibrionales bacterium]